MAYFLRQEKKKKGTYLQMYDSYWDKESVNSYAQIIVLTRSNLLVHNPNVLSQNLGIGFSRAKIDYVVLVGALDDTEDLLRDSA